MIKTRISIALEQIVVCVVAPLIFLLPVCAYAGVKLNFRWAPNQEPDIAGYRIFSRPEGQSYDYANPIWEGTTTTCSITIADEQMTHYFVVRAYDTEGFESKDSKEQKYVNGQALAVEGTPPAEDSPSDQNTPPAESPESYEEPVDGEPQPQPDSPPQVEGPVDDGPQPDNPLTDNPVTDVNHPSQQPVIEYPQNNAIVKRLSPELAAGPFHDVDSGDAHSKSRWRIDRQEDGFCVLDLTSDTWLTDIAVPPLVLDDHTSYVWAVQFYDSRGEVSEWSEPSLFTTQTVDVNAGDVSDSQLPDDSSETETGSGGLIVLDTKTDQGQIYIDMNECSGVLSIDSFTTTESDRVEDYNIESQTSILGPLYIKLSLENIGGIATVPIYFSQQTATEAKWYTQDMEIGWSDYSNHSTFREDGLSMVLELKDGGYGDVDGTENGIVVNVSGLDIAPQNDYGLQGLNSTTYGESNSWNGGCFITVTPVP